MRKPMAVDPSLTSYHQHAIKPVAASRLLDGMSASAAAFELRYKDMECAETLKAGEQGKSARFAEAERDGRRVIRLTSKVMTRYPNTKAVGRGWGNACLVRKFNGEDWSQSNRISFEVYPDLPGFRVVSLCVYLFNEGAVRLPNENVREGVHFIILKNHEWNFCTWEFPELSRDKVAGVGFEYRLQGAEPGAADTVTYDFANLKLEKVEADHTKGWLPAVGGIVFSHTGYTPGSGKTAVANGLKGGSFDIVNAGDGSVAYTGAITDATAYTGAYQVLDFTEFKDEGRYYIKAGDTVTRPFSICERVWYPTVEKVVNSFWCLRCGYPIPGIHDVCHQDFMACHGDVKKVMNGGWHDAGDLSQGIINTAEASYAMMSLARAVKEKEPELFELLFEEARWGEDWVLKTRFSDGYRASWLTMDFWTDGFIGDVDDVTHDATRRAYDNFVCAASEALAARFFSTDDPAFALFNLNAAKEDFEFAAADAKEDIRLDTYAQAVLAAIELYNATGCAGYLDSAAAYAGTVLACQQTDMPDWDVPMRGFFYTTPDKTEILHYPHRGHEQAPMVALCKLYALCPEHKDAPRWLSAVKLYAAYIKGVVRYTAPYHMMPASIYNLDEVRNFSGRRSSQNIPVDVAEAQIRQGVRLSDTHYLRLFPVWNTFRGNSGTTLSATRGVLECAVLLKDDELLEICRRQLEWHVGRNPFNQSLIWGEGYNFTPQYTATSGDIVGTLPVGIEAQHNEDVPYLPDANCYNYKEVWVHPASRWLWLMEYIYTAG